MNPIWMRLLVVMVLLTHSAKASCFGLNDVAFWVGEGEQRAGIAIDWNGDDKPGVDLPSLAWGYRWDGDATVEDALRAVVAADDRLFVKLGSLGGFGFAAFGLGYDVNDDGAFALDDGTAFNAQGVEVSAPTDGAVSVDPADAYLEGWQLSFWHFASSSGPDAEGWESAGGGISTTDLTPGGWSGFAHTPSFDFASFANELTAAQSPGLRGDFNQDGRVDAADYAVWRNELGDAESYALWRSSYGGAASAYPTLATPEPASARLFLLLLAIVAAWPADRVRRLPVNFQPGVTS